MQPRHLIIILSSLVGAFFSNAALADAYIEVVPTGWRLQNYVNGNVAVYYTGSPCVSGSLTFPGNISPTELNRFWSLVMTAKATGHTIGVYYETVSGTCQITSFYET